MSEKTTFELERMALGEIPTPPELQEEVDALREDNESVLREYPSREFAPRIEALAGGSTRPARPSIPVWATGGGILVAAVVALVLWWPQAPVPQEPLLPGTGGEVRAKGTDVRLQVWKKEGDEQELLADRSVVGAGEIVQPKFGVSKTGHAALFSIDGRGTTTIFFPEEGGSTLVEPGPMRTSSFSYELDDAPLYERFHLVVCEDPFDAPAMAARFAEGDRSQSEGCTMETVELKKR